MATKILKIHEFCKVPPFSDHSTATTPSSAYAKLPLTYFDTYWIKFGSVDTLCFYQIKDLTWDLFKSEILQKLKHSLSLTLLHYLPLAGHFIWPQDAEKPAIYYSSYPKDDGVSFTVAESYADFYLLSSNDGASKALNFRPLVPQLWISDDKAEVIAIQITLFRNHGFSVGISVHHTLIDGTSSILFLKSWAYLCKLLQQNDVVKAAPSSLLPESLIPCFDRTLIKDPSGIDVVYIKHIMASNGLDPNTRSLKPNPLDPKLVNSDKLVRRTFELTRQDLSKLKQRHHQSKSKQLHLSAYVVACAHVYACIVKAKAGGDPNPNPNPNTTVVLSFNADCRTRLDPPLPGNYFGNCVSAAEFVVAKASDFVEENGVRFVEKLSDSIRGLKGDAVVGSEDKMVRKYEMLKEMGRRQRGGQGAIVLRVSGSNRLDFYGLDFGWGKPKKVELVTVGADTDGAISLMENRDGGGVQVGVVLKKQEMETFASFFINGQARSRI